MNTIRCGVAVIVAPSTNVTTYLLHVLLPHTDNVQCKLTDNTRLDRHHQQHHLLVNLKAENKTKRKQRNQPINQSIFL